MSARVPSCLAAAIIATSGFAIAGPALQPAERPVYAVGDTWVRNDGVYELARIENERYVFTAGSGREVRLTKDLAIARVERGGIFFELDPPATIEWPLKVGAWGTSRSTRCAIGNPVGSPVIVTWKVEDTDDLAMAGRTLAAFRIRLTPRFTATGRETSLTMWYSPETRDAESRSRNFLCFLLAGTVRADVVPVDRSAPGQQANFIISTHTGSAAVSGAAVAVVNHESAKQQSVVAALPSGTAPAPPAIIRYIDLAGTGVVTITAGMFITQVGVAPPSPPAPVAALPPALRDALSENPERPR